MTNSSARTWIAAATVLLVVGAGLFLAGLAYIGWLPVGRSLEPEVIQIEVGDAVALRLSRKRGMLQAWVHQTQPEQVVPYHQHRIRPELVAVLRGKVLVQGLRKLPGDSKPRVREEIVEAGNLIYSPPGQVHEYTNIGSEPFWGLVFQSPPFRGNPTENLTITEDDFLVIPWAGPGPPRADPLPDWAKRIESPWRGTLEVFPGIPVELRRGTGRLEATGHHGEIWMALLAGSGRLTVGERSYTVAAPSWLRAPGGSWSFEGQGEAVALEFRLPLFDARLLWFRLKEKLFGSA